MPGQSSPFSTLRRLALTLATCGVVLSAQANETRERWHQAIATGYDQLASESAELTNAAQRYCAAPAPELRQRLEAQWQTAFRAWQQVRFIEFGPIEQDSLAWQFQFWPDPKNLVARKVNYWIDGDTDLTAETVKTAGVAAQGFPAAEYLLWDSRFQQSERALPNPRSCQFLVALTGHIQANADTLSANWQNLHDHFVATDDYTSTTIRSALTALEVLQDRRLAAPMGLRGSGKRNPYQADAWRSETSLAAIHGTVLGLRDHFLGGLENELKAHPELAAQVADQIGEVLSELEQLPAGMAPLLVDDEGYGQLQSLYIDVVQLEQTLTGEVATALGIARGFNSSDGD